jgi:ankyrin repeat protein
VAAYHRNVGVVAYLLGTGLVDIDALGNYPSEAGTAIPPTATALHLSVVGADEMGEIYLSTVQAPRGRSADTEVNSLLLTHEANATIRDHYSNMPIHVASRDGKRDQVEVITEHANWTINAAGRYGYTPLHFAVQNFHVDVVELLLMRGANISDGQPLLTALDRADVRLTRMLLKHGANVSGDAALAKAMTRGNDRESKEMVQLLNESGAKFDKYDKFTEALHGSLMAKRYETAEYLMKSNSTLEEQLVMGILFGMPSNRIEFMLAKADPDAAHLAGVRALIVGIATGSERIVMALLGAGIRCEGLERDYSQMQTA